MMNASRVWTRRLRTGVFMAAALTLAAASVAQQDERLQSIGEKIDRIFVSSAYAAPRFGPARWLRDGAAYTTLEPSSSGAGMDIVRYEGGGGERRVLVPGARLVPEGTSVPLGISDYVWSPDDRYLLVFTNTRRVWRQNTRGDYWVLNLESGRLRQLGGHAPESSLMFAKFSPDSSRVAYVRANNVYVERVDSGRITQLTKDGAETTINGTSDWVYEEELDLRDGFRWSPDSRAIAYWQFDTSGVGRFTLIDDTDALYPTTKTIPYPKAGTRNSAVRIGVVRASGGSTRWMKTPGASRDGYLARVSWIDPDTLAIQQLNRLQNQHDMLLADVGSGEVRRVFRDESTTWVSVEEPVLWIDHGTSFLWVSERDGWRHVFRVPREGGAALLVTRFEADITDVVGTDEPNGWLYFIASPDNATERYLYRSRLDGTGKPERVTPADAPGTHGYDLSPDATIAIHTWSQFDRPTATDIVSIPDHRPLRPLTDIGPLVATLADMVAPPVEFFQVAVADGVSLDGYMLKPASFDPTKRYPVIVNVYGEAATQTVLNRWGGSTMLFHRALVEAGYIVLSVDNRGTPAPKGAAWRKVVYGAVGDLSSRDQAAAIKAIAAKYPFVDPQRVGIWGWSGGGSSTLNAMFRFPDVYRVGVAVAPVADERLYDTIYQERYMGLPQDNVAGYRLGSPINFAEGLKGDLLVIHGSGDDNVHYQGTERLVNRLVELGKRFDLMVYPNRTHSISEGPGTTPHLYRLIARYFLEHLPPGPR